MLTLQEAKDLLSTDDPQVEEFLLAAIAIITDRTGLAIATSENNLAITTVRTQLKLLWDDRNGELLGCIAKPIELEIDRLCNQLSEA
jgi:hypothetical protein